MGAVGSPGAPEAPKSLEPPELPPRDTTGKKPALPYRDLSKSETFVANVPIPTHVSRASDASSTVFSAGPSGVGTAGGAAPPAQPTTSMHLKGNFFVRIGRAVSSFFKSLIPGRNKSEASAPAQPAVSDEQRVAAGKQTLAQPTVSDEQRVAAGKQTLAKLPKNSEITKEMDSNIKNYSLPGYQVSSVRPDELRPGDVVYFHDISDGTKALGLVNEDHQILDQKEKAMNPTHYAVMYRLDERNDASAPARQPPVPQ